MSENYAVFVEGLPSLTDFENIKADITKAARLAINSTANRIRKSSSDEVLRQINFPARYLDPSTKRLSVTSYASTKDLSAVITGRRRATSLARFVTRGTPGKIGLDVSMQKGRSSTMERAFLMRLKAGNSIETKSNLGLAVRTAKGKRPDKAYKPVKVSENLWLLYGVSVDQAFRTAREKVRPEAEAYLEAEFNRLLEVKL